MSQPPPVKCIIAACSNVRDGKERKDKVTFHHLRGDWVGRLDGLLDVNSRSKRLICSAHFKSDYIIQRNDKAFTSPDAVPELSLGEVKQKEPLRQKRVVPTPPPGPPPKKVLRRSEQQVVKEAQPEVVPEIKQGVVETKKERDDKFWLQKYKISPCSMILKKYKTKCYVPVCKTSEESTIFCAQLGRSLKPKYIVLCKRHRDVTKPYLNSYLTARLGAIQSLRTTAASSSDENEEDFFEVTKRPRPKSVAENEEESLLEIKQNAKRKKEKKLDEKKPDQVKIVPEADPEPEEGELIEPPQTKEEKNRRITRSSGSTIEADEKPITPVPTPDPTPVPTPDPTPAPVKEESISVESDEESNTKCCISNCKSKSSKQGGKFFVTKIGEEPNVEYVILCETHRTSLVNADDVGETKPPEPPKLEPSKPKPKTILDRVDYMPGQTISKRTSPAQTTKAAPVPIEPKIDTASKTKVIREQVVQLQTPDGECKDYTMREFEDNTIIYIPYKKEGKPVPAPAPQKPIVIQDDRTNLIYIGAKPYLLTDVDGLATNNEPPSKFNQLITNPAGELVIQPPLQSQARPLVQQAARVQTGRVLQPQPRPIVPKQIQPPQRRPEPVMPRIVSVQSMAEGYQNNQPVEPVPVALSKATLAVPPCPDFQSTFTSTIKPTNISVDVSGVINDPKKQVFMIGDQKVVLQKGQGFNTQTPPVNRVTPQQAAPLRPRVAQQNVRLPFNRVVNTSQPRGQPPLRQYGPRHQTFVTRPSTSSQQTQMQQQTTEAVNGALARLNHYKSIVVKNITTQALPSSVSVTTTGPARSSLQISKVSSESTTTTQSIRRGPMAKKSTGAPVFLPPTFAVVSSTPSAPKLPVKTTLTPPITPVRPMQWPRSTPKTMPTKQPDSTNTQKNTQRIYSVGLNWNKKDGNEPALVMMSTPIFFCEKCDTRFPSMMRLIGHEKLCQVGKDPLSGSGDVKNMKEKIYVCQRCQCTGCHPLSMYTHLRRCLKLHEAPEKETLTTYLCAICRVTTSVSLGEMIAHLDVACPILNNKPSVKIEPQESKDIVIIDSDDE